MKTKQHGRQDLKTIRIIKVSSRNMSVTNKLSVLQKILPNFLLERHAFLVMGVTSLEIIVIREEW